MSATVVKCCLQFGSTKKEISLKYAVNANFQGTKISSDLKITDT